jgi:hypothetical protein
MTGRDARPITRLEPARAGKQAYRRAHGPAAARAGIATVEVPQ